MIFKQYELGCLSLFSYLIGDETTGRAVVVDPQRDVAQYLADAEDMGLTIERVVETHFHADFLSGHLELAAATGAVISFGEEARADFPIDPLAHGEQLSLGEVLLEIRHTPGHTPESISIVVWERATDHKPWAVLTGDTLFIGDVGRPDLLTSIGWTADDLARRLYRSLHDQILTLPDSTMVYPSHGAGSACGKNLSTAAVSTVGEQRHTNYALAPMSEDEFVHAVTQGQTVAPLYFAFAADSNRRERELLDDNRDTQVIEFDTALRLQAEGAVVIDARSADVFASGHLRGSINVGLDGRFAEYCGDVLRPGQSVVLVAPPGRANEARIRLARIGFDRVVGSLEDIELELLARPELAERAPKVTAAEVAQWQLGGRWQLRGQGQSSGQQQSGGQERSGGQELQILDVRNPGELEDGAMNGARNVPLPQLLDRISELEPAVTTVVYCAGGYRSSTAASLLRSSGFANVVEISGGYAAASQDHSIPTVDVRAAADRPVGVALLDVREPEEWDEGHAVDAIHQPLGSLDASTLPFEGSVYVICRSGNRSATAARQLRAAGIDAHNVVGGMLAWTAAGLPATHTA